MIKVRYRRIGEIGRWLIALGVIVAATYPIIISPMINPEPYKEAQKIGRKNIVQEDIQPGNMKVWTDPFDRKKKNSGEEEHENGRNHGRKTSPRLAISMSKARQRRQRNH